MIGYQCVVIEMQVAGGWKSLGRVSEVEPAGSFSNDEPEGRQIYIFGWHNNEGPAVWKSTGGADLTNEVIREITTFGLQKIADLRQGPHLMMFWRIGSAVPIRFREATT